MRFGTILKLAAVGILLLIVTLVTVVKSVDIDAYRGLLSGAARSATGRDLVIRGKLSLKVSLTPSLVANDVVFTNAAWGRRPEMLKIDRVEAEIGLLPLLVREVRVSRLTFINSDILLEADGQGRVNWDFAAAPVQDAPPITNDEAHTALRIGEVKFEGANIGYFDAASGRSEHLRVDHLTADADTFNSPLALKMEGLWNGRHFDVSGVLGAPKDLLHPGRPYNVEMKAVLAGLVATASGSVRLDKSKHPLLAITLHADATDLAETARMVGVNLPAMGAARISLTVAGRPDAPSLTDIDLALGRRDAVALSLKGSIKDPLAVKGVDIGVTAEGDNLAAFNKVLNVAMPAVGPIKLAGHLADVESGWRLGDFKAILGHSDLAGEATLRPGRDRPLLEAHLTSNAFDLADWSVSKSELPHGRGDDIRLFSDEALPMSFLSASDADLSWQIDRLFDDGLSASQVVVPISVRNGSLEVIARIGAIGGGKLKGALTVESLARPPIVSVLLKGERVALGTLLRGFDLSPVLHGAVGDFHLALKGSGSSWRMIFSRLNGDVALSVGKGSIEASGGDSLAVDLLQQLANGSKSTDTELQCLVGHFSVADGLARSETLLFDTTQMTVAGQGSINLANETLDLSFAPKPKEVAAASLTPSLDVGGTLAHPTIAPNKGTIVKGVLSAVGAGAVPFIALGQADANPCIAALVQPKKAPPVRKSGKLSGGAEN